MSEEVSSKNSIDLNAARVRAAENGGKRFWQSLEELSETKEYRDFLENEFPANAGTEVTALNRRDALKLMAASTAMAGLSACTKLPEEKIVPYVHPPEEIIPGRPLFYATSFNYGGAATGLLVESHMGRPTKIEGNPSHPGSKGRADLIAQASILNLYDPDRSQAVIYDGRISTWETFIAAMQSAHDRLTPRGTGLRVLTGTVTSPTLAA